MGFLDELDASMRTQMRAREEQRARSAMTKFERIISYIFLVAVLIMLVVSLVMLGKGATTGEKLTDISQLANAQNITVAPEKFEKLDIKVYKEDLAEMLSDEKLGNVKYAFYRFQVNSDNALYLTTEGVTGQGNTKIFARRDYPTLDKLIGNFEAESNMFLGDYILYNSPSLVVKNGVTLLIWSVVGMVALYTWKKLRVKKR